MWFMWSLMVFFLWLCPAKIFAQQYINQKGHFLDANPRLGSFGWNTRARLDSLVPRSDLYITGNITGGGSFQGLIPYRSPLEFSGNLGSSALSDFRRDSVGAGDLSRSGVVGQRPFVDQSRALTGSWGNRVGPSPQIYEPTSVTPVGSLLRTRPYGLSSSGISARPLGGSYSMNVTPGPVPFGITGSLPQTDTASQSPWQRSSTLPRTTSSTDFDRLINPPANQPGQTPEGPPGGQTPQENSLPQRNWTEPSSSQSSPPQGTPALPSPLEEFDVDKTPLPPDGAAALVPEANPQDQSQGENLTQEFAPRSRTEFSESLTGTGQPSAFTSQKTVLSGSFADFYRQQADYYLEQGRTFLQQGKYYFAANAFGNAVLYDPQNGGAYLAKSQALFAAGEFMSAAYFLNQALTLTPELTSQRTDLRQFFPDAKQFQARLDELEAWQNRTRQPMLKFLQGYVLYQIDQWIPAKEALSEYLQAQPDAASAQLLINQIDLAQHQENASAPPGETSPPQVK